MADKLAERVRSTRQGRGGDPAAGREVDRRPDEAALIEAVRKMQTEFAKAMGPIRGEAAEQLVRDATTEIRRNPKLALCNRASVLGGLMTMAQLGLRIGVLGHGWLIPMWNDKRREQMATLIIGYKGYTKLAYNAAALRDLRSRTIFAADEYGIEYGTEERLIHRPAMTADRGEPIGYYCVVNLNARQPGQPGGKIFHFRSQAEMEAHRDRYAMSREFDWSSGKPKAKFNPDGSPIITGPWRDNFEEMAWKTEWLTIARFVPMSADLELATFADGTARLDLSANNRDAAATGERLGDTIVDGDVVEAEAAAAEAEQRERVVVSEAPRETAEDGTTGAPRQDDTPDEPAPATDEPTAEQAPDDLLGRLQDSIPAGRTRQAAIRGLYAAMKPCGITNDVGVIVMVAALNDWTFDSDNPADIQPVPGSLDGFSEAQLRTALDQLAGWRQQGDEAAMCELLLQHRPDQDHPVWEQAERARAEHENSKRPSSRRGRKSKEEEGSDGSAG
jgi:recombination protein RecT